MDFPPLTVQTIESVFRCINERKKLCVVYKIIIQWMKLNAENVYVNAQFDEFGDRKLAQDLKTE